MIVYWHAVEADAEADTGKYLKAGAAEIIILLYSATKGVKRQGVYYVFLYNSV